MLNTGTGFLKTDFAGNTSILKILIDHLVLSWESEEQSQMKKKIKERSRHQFDFITHEEC